MTSPRPVVLVVDDEPDVREMIRNILEAAGFEARPAADGREALDVVRRLAGRAQLVLTDVMMPGLDGPTLARQLAELEPMLPVLFMTGYTSEALAARGLLAQDVPRLEKPFRVGELLRLVRAAIRG